jgi:hypothetical protein
MKGRGLLLVAVLALAGAVVLARRSNRRGRRPALGYDPKTDAQLDEAIKATFPASDPIAIGQIE